MLDKSPFLKSILLLTSGSFLAQSITALSMPILTRMYAPEVMGKYTYIISVAAIFLSVINGRYDVSIVTEKKEEYVFPLIKLCLVVGILVAATASLSFGGYFYFSGRETWMAVYVFLILLSYSLIDVFTAFNNREKDYKTISSVYVIRTAFQSLGGILGGLSFANVHCLTLPYAIGLFAGLKRQARPLRNRIREILSVSWSEVINVAKIHRKQPIFSAPALLANSLSYSLITILLESLYGLEQVGYYAISVRLLGLPLALVGSNVSKVYLERASKEFNSTGQYYTTFKKTFSFLLIIAIPIVFVLFFTATPICTIVLGKNWAEAGRFIVILAPMFGVRLITSVMSPSFVIVKKQRMELILQSLFVLSNLLTYFVAKFLQFDIYEYLKILSILFSSSYSLYLFMIFFYSEKRNSIWQK